MVLTMMMFFHKQRVQNGPTCFSMFNYLTIRLRVAVVVVSIFLCWRNHPNHNIDHIPPRQDREDAPPRGTVGQMRHNNDNSTSHLLPLLGFGPAGCAERFESCNPGGDSSEVSSAVLANASYTVTGHRRALLNSTCSVTGDTHELLAIASYSVTGHRRALLTTTSDVALQCERYWFVCWCDAAGGGGGLQMVVGV